MALNEPGTQEVDHDGKSGVDISHSTLETESTDLQASVWSLFKDMKQQSLKVQHDALHWKATVDDLKKQNEEMKNRLGQLSRECSQAEALAGKHEELMQLYMKVKGECEEEKLKREILIEEINNKQNLMNIMKKESEQNIQQIQQELASAEKNNEEIRELNSEYRDCINNLKTEKEHNNQVIIQLKNEICRAKEKYELDVKKLLSDVEKTKIECERNIQLEVQRANVQKYITPPGFEGNDISRRESAHNRKFEHMKNYYTNQISTLKAEVDRLSNQLKREKPNGLRLQKF